MEPFYRDALATLYHADSTRLEFLADHAVDLTITSPPYNLAVEYGGYRDDVPYQEYLGWVGQWATALLRASASGGRACINVPLDTNKGGKRAVYADYVRVFTQAGWRYQTTIVWNEQNISRRTAWGSWRRPSAPFITAPVEMVAVFYKDEWCRPPGGRTWRIPRDDFLDWTLGLWTFPGQNPGRVGHPAPFPPELPRRLMLLYSYEQDVILDPFVGCGTTCLVASRLGRRSIGVEIDRGYCETARALLQAAHSLSA